MLISKLKLHWDFLYVSNEELVKQLAYLNRRIYKAKKLTLKSDIV